MIKCHGMFLRLDLVRGLGGGGGGEPPLLTLEMMHAQNSAQPRTDIIMHGKHFNLFKCCGNSLHTVAC